MFEQIEATLLVKRASLKQKAHHALTISTTISRLSFGVKAVILVKLIFLLLADVLFVQKWKKDVILFLVAKREKLSW